MQIRVLIGIFTLFTCILLFMLIRYYIDAKSIYSLPEVKPYILAEVDNNATRSLEVDWIDKLSGQGVREYIYPATELQVRLLFAESPKTTSKETFRVSVGVISDYQFFCINQVFVANDIEYSYYKVGESIWLVVVAENEDYLHSVLKQLKHYEINYTLSKT